MNSSSISIRPVGNFGHPTEGEIAVDERLWELAVETYLAHDRGLFLNPQYWVGEPGVWDAYPDFVAINFPDSIAWMVEVTTSPRESLFAKIRQFENKYVPRIKEQLLKYRVIRTNEPGWTIGLWIFAPSKRREVLDRQLRAGGVQKFQLAPLEDAAFPPSTDLFR
jgi:hypothetical protein